MFIHVGDRLRELQKKRCINCRELGERMGKSQQQISRWRKSSDLKVHTVQSLCKALDVSIAEFLAEKSPR